MSRTRKSTPAPMNPWNVCWCAATAKPSSSISTSSRSRSPKPCIASTPSTALACERTSPPGGSVETEPVAPDDLHHQARLVDAISAQQSHTRRAERYQSCTFGLECGDPLVTYEPGTDPHVEMQPILHDL